MWGAMPNKVTRIKICTQIEQVQETCLYASSLDSYNLQVSFMKHKKDESSKSHNVDKPFKHEKNRIMFTLN